jgi:hypothetical protein
MPELGDLAPPIMRGRTRLDPDQARRQFGEERQYLLATQRPAHHHCPRRIDPVHLEDLLGQIQPDRCNLCHGWLPFVGVVDDQLWHTRCHEGAIHPIKPVG